VHAAESVLLYLYGPIAVAGVTSFRTLERERQLREAAKTFAAQERLRALRSQLNTHFLFNALNSVAAFSAADPAAAEELITQLSALIRETLRASEHEEHALSKEIAHAESYLRIRELRTPSRLTWQVSTDATAATSLVPSLILLPLVENAVTHGLRGAAHQVQIGIQGRREADTIALTAINTCGTGRAITEPARSGFGLRNTRERLEILFGSRASLHAPLERLHGEQVSRT
jgi:two-component system, LytTR family, sensor kinase